MAAFHGQWQALTLAHIPDTCTTCKSSLLSQPDLLTNFDRMAAVDKDYTALQDERKRAEGVAADLQHAVFDQELYGGSTERFAGYDRSIGLADTEEEMDEREQAVRRCAGLCLLSAIASSVLLKDRDCVFLLVIRSLTYCSVSSQQNAVLYCPEVCHRRPTCRRW